MSLISQLLRNSEREDRRRHRSYERGTSTDRGRTRHNGRDTQSAPSSYPQTARRGDARAPMQESVNHRDRSRRDIDLSPDTRRTAVPKFKLCRHFATKDAYCPRGNRCGFAHSLAQLKLPAGRSYENYTKIWRDCAVDYWIGQTYGDEQRRNFIRYFDRELRENRMDPNSTGDVTNIPMWAQGAASFYEHWLGMPPVPDGFDWDTVSNQRLLSAAQRNIFADVKEPNLKERLANMNRWCNTPQSDEAARANYSARDGHGQSWSGEC